MSIDDLQKISETNKNNAIAYADCICGALERALIKKKQLKEGEKLASTYRDSIGVDIRKIQNYFYHPLSTRAKKLIKEELGLDIKEIKYRDQKKINRMWKDKNGIDTSRLNASLLNWEHYHGGLKALCHKLIDLEEPIKDPIELLKFISENTFIVSKLKGVEDHIDHNTSIDSLNDWEAQ